MSIEKKGLKQVCVDWDIDWGIYEEEESFGELIQLEERNKKREAERNTKGSNGLWFVLTGGIDFGICKEEESIGELIQLED
jgi:hypothetical protein